MDKFKSKSQIQLHAGCVQLTDAQYASRKHALKRVGTDTYDVLSAIEFKAGETFGYDGVLPKSKISALIPAAKPEADAVQEPIDDPKKAPELDQPTQPAIVKPAKHQPKLKK